jgi:hypothetical protein
MAHSYSPRFPHPRFKKKGDDRDFDTRILARLETVAHRFLNARRRAGRAKYSVEALADLLHQWALTNGPEYIQSTEKTGRDRGDDFISYDRLDYLTEKAATFTLARNSEAAFVAWNKKRAAAGGRKSKRPAEFVWDAAWGDISELKNVDIQKRLGCKSAVVTKIRRRFFSAPPSKPKSAKRRYTPRPGDWPVGPIGSRVLPGLATVTMTPETDTVILALLEGVHDKPLRAKPARTPEPTFADIIHEPKSETADHMTRFVALAKTVSPTYRPADLLAGAGLRGAVPVSSHRRNADQPL